MNVKKVYVCLGCKKKLKYYEVDDHQNKCLEINVLCPNGCNSYVKRRDLKFHNSECRCVKVFCPYREFGFFHFSTN